MMKNKNLIKLALSISIFFILKGNEVFAQLGEPIKEINILTNSSTDFIFTIGSDGIVHYVKNRPYTSLWVKKGKIRYTEAYRNNNEPLIITQLASGRSSEGYSFLFGLSKTGKLYKSYYDQDIWSNWVSFDAPVAFTQIKAMYSAAGLMVIGLNDQGNVYWNVQDYYYGGPREAPPKHKDQLIWKGWNNLNAANLNQVVGCTTGPFMSGGQEAILAKNKIEGSVYYTIRKNGLGWPWILPWKPLGGTQLKSIDAITNKDGRFVLFAVGADERLYEGHQISVLGDWSEWTTLGGSTIKQISSETSKAGRVTVFALHTDGSVDHIWQNDPGGETWSVWVSLYGTGIQAIETGKSEDGRMLLMAIGGDGKAYYRWQATPDGSWENWGNLSDMQIWGN